MPATKTWKHWCPNECGKKVVYEMKLRLFVCKKCKAKFTKQELKEAIE